MNATAPNVEEHLPRGPGDRAARPARAAYLGRGLRRRRRRCAARSSGCSRPTTQAGDFLEAPAVDADGRPSSPPASRGPARSSAPTSCWSRSARGAWASSTWPSRPQPVRRKVALKVIKPGMDTQAGRRPVRGRAAGPGDDGPPQHRQGPRRRHHRLGPPLLRHGAGPRHPDHRVLRPRAALDPPSGWSCSSWSAGPCSTPTRRGSSTATSSRPTSWSRCTTACRCPRSSTSASPRPPAQQLTEKTLFTGFAPARRHAAVHEPRAGRAVAAWTSTPAATSTRLGVLLYELLTGTTPFDQETLRKAAFDEMRRIIREEEPPRPSTRLSTLGATLDDRLGQPRGPTRGGWTAPSAGELDWIVMKALEKDRRRRYETANDFAADVMRYLTDQPVEACPPSAWYRFAKFARRNRAVLTTAVWWPGPGRGHGRQHLAGDPGRRGPNAGPRSDSSSPARPSTRCTRRSPRSGWPSSPG